MMPPKEKEKKEKYNKDNNSRLYTLTHFLIYYNQAPDLEDCWGLHGVWLEKNTENAMV